ncbi:MAG: peptidylprolyl isomerase [Oscillibacter sp.]|nr:peptidylprolyl isomerase [Oscillibacter sp.]
MKKHVSLLAAILLCLVLAACGKAAPTAPETPEYTLPPAEEREYHHAEIEIEDYGTITVELDATAAPLTVENFLALAQSGYYDGLTFHRIMQGFMMQGGANPNDPAAPIKGEFISNGVENDLEHLRGAISMARAQDPDSASSQFFICQVDCPHLDGNYACFGYVTDGIEVVDAVCDAATPVDSNGAIAPEAQPVIAAVRVLD